MPYFSIKNYFYLKKHHQPSLQVFQLHFSTQIRHEKECLQKTAKLGPLHNCQSLYFALTDENDPNVEVYRRMGQLLNKKISSVRQSLTYNREQNKETKQNYIIAENIVLFFARKMGH